MCPETHKRTCRHHPGRETELRCSCAAPFLTPCGMCDLGQADACCLQADTNPATAPWLRPGTFIPPGGTQAAHPLLSLQAVAGVGVVLHSSKIAIEQWPVCSWGFSSPCRFSHGTVGALAGGSLVAREAAVWKGSQHQPLATLIP